MTAGRPIGPRDEDGLLTRPTLLTERLRLEPLGPEHAEDVVALDGDADVMRYLTGRARTRAEVLEEWLPVLTEDAGADGRLGYWAGLAEAGVVGWWCLNPAPDDPGDAELGYRLRRAAWGHGYATEGAAALLMHAFDTVGLAHVWAQTMAVNHPSRAVMERIGLVFERTWVGEWNEPLPGWEQGEVAYGITREQWRARRP